MLGGKLFICTITSWRARINIVANTIRSLFANTIVPDKIVLNLSATEFPLRDKELPSDLVELALHSPLEIYWVDGNSRAFKKLIPTLDRYRDAIVMTNDDDIIYPKDFLEEVTSHYDFVNPLTLNGGKEWGSGYGSMYEYRHFGKYLHAFDRQEVWNTNEDDIAYGCLMLLNGYAFSHYGYNYRKIEQVDEAHGMCANGWYNSARNDVWFNNYIQRRFSVDYKWLRDCIKKGIKFELQDKEPITNDTLIQRHLSFVEPIVKQETINVPPKTENVVKTKENRIVEQVKVPTKEELEQAKREKERNEKKSRFLGEIKHTEKKGVRKELRKIITR